MQLPEIVGGTAHLLVRRRFDAHHVPAFKTFSSARLILPICSSTYAAVVSRMAFYAKLTPHKAALVSVAQISSAGPG